VRVLLGRRVLWWLISSCHDIRVACYKEQIRGLSIYITTYHKNAFIIRSEMYMNGMTLKKKKITDLSCLKQNKIAD
jgi:hypothetical protein